MTCEKWVGFQASQTWGVAAEFATLSSIVPGYVCVKFTQCHKFAEFNPYLRKFPKMSVPPKSSKIRSFSSIEAHGSWGTPMTSETLTLRWRKDVKTPRWRRRTSPEIGTLQNWRLMALGLLHGEVETINVFWGGRWREFEPNSMR